MTCSRENRPEGQEDRYGATCKRSVPEHQLGEEEGGTNHSLTPMFGDSEYILGWV